MKEILIEVIKIAGPLAVAVVVFTQGLGISSGRVLAYFRKEPALVLRSLIATVVVVPVAALALILMLKPSPGLTIGLAILVSCPPAPMMVATAATKGGANAAFMAILHLSLAAIAFVTVPAVLFLLSTFLGFSADVEPGTIMWILSRTILLPVGLGLAARAAYPALADRWGPGLAKIGNAATAIVLLLLIWVFWPVLLNMDRWSYLVIAAVSVVALAIGHLAGPADPHEKTALAVECASRHPVLAMAIGGANFGVERTLPILAPCILTSSAVAILYLVWRRIRTR